MGDGDILSTKKIWKICQRICPAEGPKLANWTVSLFDAGEKTRLVALRPTGHSKPGECRPLWHPRASSTMVAETRLI